MEQVYLYIIWFIIYSVVGWIMETIFCSIEVRRFVNRGFLNGPYCPIYGCGALLDIALLSWIENPFLIFLAGAFVSAVLEYVTSWTMEKLFHARWWDYSEHKFNLNGRICLDATAAFGVGAVVAVKVANPLVTSLTAQIPGNVLPILAWALALAFITDTVVTSITVSRLDQKLAKLLEDVNQLTGGVQQTAGKYRDAVMQKLGDSELTEKLGALYSRFLKMVNRQEHRILAAFPKIKSTRDSGIVKNIKDFAKSMLDKM